MASQSAQQPAQEEAPPAPQLPIAASSGWTKAITTSTTEQPAQAEVQSSTATTTTEQPAQKISGGSGGVHVIMAQGKDALSQGQNMKALQSTVHEPSGESEEHEPQTLGAGDQPFVSERCFKKPTIV